MVNRIWSGARVWSRGAFIARGDDVVKFCARAGDHLFVDRLTYNFRKPARGEIIVFETKGINHPQMPQDQFYIKRMVVLPRRTGADR